MSDRHRHPCDCTERDRCEYCGCCYHCDDRCWCKANEAPAGMSCAVGDCACEGRS